MWGWSQAVAYSFALPHELAEFDAEFGPCQPKEQRQDHLRTPSLPPLIRSRPMGYKISEQSERNVALQKAKSKYSSIVDTQTKSKITSMFNWLRRRQNAGLRNVEYSKKQVEKAEKDGKKNELKSCQVDGKTSWSPYTTPYAVIMDVSDPTRAKPLKALLWINLLMSKIEAKCPPAAQNAGFMKMAAINQINALNAHLQNVCKIDTLVLPLPYNQLLRTFLLIWNFTLPFVIASEVGWFNPIVMFLISAAFFGLDQVGPYRPYPSAHTTTLVPPDSPPPVTCGRLRSGCASPLWLSFTPPPLPPCLSHSHRLPPASHSLSFTPPTLCGCLARSLGRWV